MTETGIGASVRRKEDRRFLTGKGTYVDDIDRPGQVYAYFLRSPHAHAGLKKVDTAKAKKAPGVLAIHTGADLAEGGVNSLPCGWLIHNKDGTPMAEPPHLPLAADKVRYVGDGIALVIAETAKQAKSAAQLIAVDYDVLPAAIDMTLAIGDGAPQLHDDVPANTCYDWEIGDKAATEAAFATADHVTSIEIINNRLIPNAVEPRVVIAEYEAASGEYTVHLTTQNPHVNRLLMGAFVLGIPEHKLRIVAPDVGGGFGSKIAHYAEEAALTWAAARLGRPIKWTAERTEAFLCDTHGRDNVTEAQLALDKDGKFLGLRVKTLANMGAYLSTFGSAVPTILHSPLLAGVYTTPAICSEVRAVFTNTVPVDAYRGAGRPEATYILERLVDRAAREMGIDPVAIRKRNFIPPDAFPYASPVAMHYDTGDYEPTLDAALELADYAGFAKRKAASAKAGKLRGIGLSTYVEACGAAPSAIAGQLGARAGLYESAEVRVHPTGSVTVFTGSHSHGQGHETAFAQLICETLGVDIEAVDVVHGDTARVQFGMGTYGSRSLAVGGEAIVRAAGKVVDKAKKIAAHILEAAEGDITFENGTFSVAGTDKSLAFGEVALAAYVPHNYPLETLEPGLDETCFFDPLNFTFPAGCHVCEVEVDPETGVVEIADFTAVDDVGRVINPMIVEGQVHGGIAQGVGQALFEECVYDADGQLLTGSLLDYNLPRADGLPSFKVGNKVTLCQVNTLGVKGVGEVGSIGSPAAVINAVVDALSELGIDDVRMPAKPERVWQAIQDAKAAG